jgi:TonB family protein
LLYGFGLSILLHLLIGPLVQFKRTPEAPEPPQQTVKIERMPTPPPTPKPTPKPTPTPPPTPPPKSTPPPKNTPPPQAIKINTAKTTAHTGGPSEAANTHTTGSENGSPQGTGNSPSPATPSPATAPPTQAPTPVPTPTPPQCAQPNVPATTINAVPAETPQIAAQQGITGEVTVQVTLDENSKLVDAKVVRTPSAILNNAALASARQSTFKTRIANCKPVADTYLFTVDFQSQ